MYFIKDKSFDPLSIISFLIISLFGLSEKSIHLMIILLFKHFCNGSLTHLPYFISVGPMAIPMSIVFEVFKSTRPISTLNYNISSTFDRLQNWNTSFKVCDQNHIFRFAKEWIQCAQKRFIGIYFDSWHIESYSLDGFVRIHIVHNVFAAFCILTCSI